MKSPFVRPCSDFSWSTGEEKVGWEVFGRPAKAEWQLSIKLFVRPTPSRVAVYMFHHESLNFGGSRSRPTQVSSSQWERNYSPERNLIRAKQRRRNGPLPWKRKLWPRTYAFRERSRHLAGIFYTAYPGSKCDASYAGWNGNYTRHTRRVGLATIPSPGKVLSISFTMAISQSMWTNRGWAPPRWRDRTFRSSALLSTISRVPKTRLPLTTSPRNDGTGERTTTEEVEK